MITQFKDTPYTVDLHRKCYQNNETRRETTAMLCYLSVQVFYLWIGRSCSEMFIRDVLGCANYASIPPDMVSRVQGSNDGLDSNLFRMQPPIGLSALRCCWRARWGVFFFFLRIAESHSWVRDAAVGESAGVCRLAAGQPSVQLHDARDQVSNILRPHWNCQSLVGLRVK